MKNCQKIELCFVMGQKPRAQGILSLAGVFGGEWGGVLSFWEQDEFSFCYGFHCEHTHYKSLDYNSETD